MSPKPSTSFRFSPLIWVINIRSAFTSLMSNKLRTSLAMLGIMIGVGAVIAMLAMGAGAQAQVVARINAMGSNVLIVRPTERGTGGVMSGTQQNLTVQDALALRDLPDVAAISPGVQNGAQLAHLNHNTNSDINGVASSYFAIRNFEAEFGRVFTDDEVDSVARVVVIGPVVAANLFVGDDPIGQTIKVKGINFKVIGVMKSKGSNGWTGPDDECFVPYTTAMKILFGLTYIREIDISANPGVDLNRLSGEPVGTGGWGRRVAGTVHTTPPAEDTIAGVLRHRHRLLDLKDPDDFRVMNQAEILQQASDTVMVFRILLGSIAAISLLVGGIGIMNIMLVTVIERTREIGTRKAIGAHNNDILMQFMMESVMLSGIGGLLGASLGIGLAKGIPLIPRFNNFLTIVDPSYVLLSVTFAAVVGIVFGVYPAWRASRLDPIEALRYE
ncbi:MAG TPA: ABC transporter permease [Phycisphaerae bacterium]|nr:ABC transporter permease [Phycisphaerae bacterium]